MKSALNWVTTSRRSELTLRKPSQFHVIDINFLRDLCLHVASELESELSAGFSLKDFQGRQKEQDHQDFLLNHLCLDENLWWEIW